MKRLVLPLSLLWNVGPTVKYNNAMSGLRSLMYIAKTAMSPTWKVLAVAHELTRYHKRMTINDVSFCHILLVSNMGMSFTIALKYHLLR